MIEQLIMIYLVFNVLIIMITLCLGHLVEEEEEVPKITPTLIFQCLLMLPAVLVVHIIDRVKNGR